MDLISFYLFEELTKDMNMSRTAERIYVSQQTISNHILRLEEYYGTPLFYRKPRLSLTYAGEKVLQFAETLNREHTNLKDLLGEIEGREVGLLRFGTSPLRANMSLPVILPAFSARYPNVTLEVTSAFADELEPLVTDGKLDFAAVLTREKDPAIEARPLMNDPLYLCIEESLLENCLDDPEGFKQSARQGLEIRDTAVFPLCTHENRMGDQIRAVFQQDGIVPRIYMNCTDTQLSFSIACQGLAACFASHSRLAGELSKIPDTLNIFPLYSEGEVFRQKLSLIYRKDRYLTAYSQYFSELLQKYFTQISQIRMVRTV